MTRRTLVLIRIAWIAATVLLMVTWNSNAWVLLIVLVALGPILREVAPAPDLDERQRLLDYRASHYALIVTFVLLFVLHARSWFQLQREPPVELWLLLFAPVVVRTSISAAQGFGTRKMALILGFACGALWLAFSTAERPLSPESAVGLGIIAFTALGIRWPYVGGALLVLAALACAVFLIPVGIRNTGGHWVFVLVMIFALPLPPLLAGLGLIGAAAGAARSSGDEFGDLRRTK